MKWHRRVRHALAHSLRVRLVALFLMLALGMAGVFLLGMQAALSIGWRDAARPLVTDYIDRLVAEIGTPPRIDQAQALAQRLPIRIRISGPEINWSSHPDSEQRFDDEWHGRNDEPRLLERTTADGHRIALALHVSVWNERPRFIGWATLAALLGLTALAYWRVRRMLRPLDDIRTGALRFGAGEFEQPIPVRRAGHPDELTDLADTINTMAQDIRNMLDAKRTLLLAISHELRSPLTRARLNTELLPETEEVRPNRDALLSDLALMRDLITDLLESERLAQRHAVLQREPLDMVGLVRAEAETLLARKYPSPDARPALLLDLPVDPLQVSGDAVRLKLLVRNLVDNALRHGGDAPQGVELRLRPGPSGGAELSVRDHGPGVSEEQIDKLAQPFYRPDAARERSTGGVGLGLYLCKLVVLAHGGSFRIANAHPGLEVTLTIP